MNTGASSPGESCLARACPASSRPRERVTVSESQTRSNVDVATGAVDGEAADVIDETSGFADEPAGDEAATDEAATDEGATDEAGTESTASEAERATDEAGAESTDSEAPTEDDTLAEFMREMRMQPGDWYV